LALKKPCRKLKIARVDSGDTDQPLGQDGPDRRYIGGMGVTIWADTFRQERQPNRTPIAAVIVIKDT
jgi:hypothetical protein